MTELEKRIHDCAIKELPRIKERIKLNKSKCRYLQFTFMCDGVYDFIVYDKTDKTFTIEYTYGKGSSVSLDGLSGAFFDDFEIRKIIL